MILGDTDIRLSYDTGRRNSPNPYVRVACV